MNIYIYAYIHFTLNPTAYILWPRTSRDSTGTSPWFDSIRTTCRVSTLHPTPSPPQPSSFR